MQLPIMTYNFNIISVFKFQILISFNYNKKEYFIHFFEQNLTVFSDDKTHTEIFGIKNCSLNNFIKNNKNQSYYFIMKSDVNFNLISQLLNSNKKKYAFFDYKNPQLFTSFKGILENYKNQCDVIYKEINSLILFSSNTKIPILNLCEMKTSEILDTLFYNYSRKIFLNFITENTIHDKTNDFFIKKSFLNCYSALIEIPNTLILAILAENLILEDLILENKLFIAEMNIFKKIANLILNNNDVTSEKLLKNFENWIKKDLKLILNSVKEYLNLLQKKYIYKIINQIEKLGGVVLFFNKNLMLIETSKKDFSGCIEFLKYINRSINLTKGFEKIKFGIINIYEKFVIADEFHSFFVLPDNERSIEKDIELINEKENINTLSINNEKTIEESRIFTTGENKIPIDFLILFFSQKLSNDYFYDLLLHKKYKDIKSINLMLKVYETITNIDSLRSSCYEKLEINEFAIKEYEILKFEIYCKNCKFEGIANINLEDISNCYKCLEKHDKNIIDDKIIQIFKERIYNSDLICEKCNKNCDRKLKSKCICGGELQRKYSLENILNIYDYIKDENKKEKMKILLDNYF
ncbi:DNA polymerase epsilon catalytic subunit [Gurleya vavrai]